MTGAPLYTCNYFHYSTDRTCATPRLSPHGRLVAFAVLTFDVALPVRALVLFRPGDQSSLVIRELPFYPYGPISWR